MSVGVGDWDVVQEWEEFHLLATDFKFLKVTQAGD